MASVRQVLPRVGDLAGQRACGDGCGRGKKDLGFFMSHATRKIAVGGADAFHGRVHSAKSIDRSTQAGGAACILSHLHARFHEDVPHCLVTPSGSLQIMNNLGCGRNAEGIDGHSFPSQNAGEFQEIARLAAGA